MNVDALKAALVLYDLRPPAVKLRHIGGMDKTILADSPLYERVQTPYGTARRGQSKPGDWCAKPQDGPARISRGD